MIRFVYLTVLFSAGFWLLAGCQPDQTRHRPERPHPFGYRGATGTTDVEPTGPPTQPNAPEPDTTTPPPPPPPTEERPSTPAAPTTPKRADYPYATPVPGKSGFVTSPYEPYRGYVDVRGYPPGTEVRDPYSGKIFLVP